MWLAVWRSELWRRSCREYRVCLPPFSGGKRDDSIHIVHSVTYLSQLLLHFRFKGTVFVCDTTPVQSTRRRRRISPADSAFSRRTYKINETSPRYSIGNGSSRTDFYNTRINVLHTPPLAFPFVARTCRFWRQTAVTVGQKNWCHQRNPKRSGVTNNVTRRLQRENSAEIPVGQNLWHIHWRFAFKHFK